MSASIQNYQASTVLRTFDILQQSPAIRTKKKSSREILGFSSRIQEILTEHCTQIFNSKTTLEEDERLYALRYLIHCFSIKTMIKEDQWVKSLSVYVFCYEMLI